MYPTFFSRILDHSLEYSAIHMNVLIFHWCIHRFQWDFESFIGVFNHSYECFDYPLMYPVFPMMFLIIHRGIQPFLMIFGSSICCWCNESSESQPFIDSTKGPSVLLLSVCHQERERDVLYTFISLADAEEYFWFHYLWTKWSF